MNDIETHLLHGKDKRELNDWVTTARRYLEVGEELAEGRRLLKNALESWQQAIEWIAKAVLISHNISFKETHSLKYLAERLDSIDPSLSMCLRHVTFLERFAGASRYNTIIAHTRSANLMLRIRQIIRTAFDTLHARVLFDPQGLEIQSTFGRHDVKASVRNDFYSYNSEQIAVSAFLPTVDRISQASCCFTFKRITVSGTMLTFAHKQILSQLFSGLRSPANSNLRPFIVSAPEPVCGFEHYLIQLGNVHFGLGPAATEELCHVIDGLATSYLARLSEIQEKLGIQHFTVSSKYEGGFRLIEVTKEVWEACLFFGRRFDIRSPFEKTDWHVFDVQGYAVRVFPDRVDAMGRDLSFTLQAEASRWDSSDQVAIVWQRPIGDWAWNAWQVYEWLVGTFVPKVIFWLHRNKRHGLRRLFRRKTFNEFKNSFELDRFISRAEVQESQCNFIASRKTEASRTQAALILLARQLQNFYYMNERTYISSTSFKSLETALALCLKKLPLGDLRWHYIRNLYQPDSHGNTLTADQTPNSSRVELALRALVHGLESKNMVLDRDDIDAIKDYLEPLDTLYRESLLIKKFSNY